MRTNTYFNWPGKIYIISDPHFGDKGILKYERTRFETTKEHDDFIVNLINKKLQKSDTLVCLGDMGFKWEEPFSRVKQCAKKVLILGNHDGQGKGTYKKYFDDVYNGPLFINRFVVLSHEPIPIGEQFLNIHGHLHSSYLDTKNHKNISIAMNDYLMYDLDEAQSFIEKAPRIKAEFLEEWYADNYIFTDRKSDCLMYKDTFHVIPKENIEAAVKYVNLFLITDDDEYKDFKIFIKERKYDGTKVNVSHKTDVVKLGHALFAEYKRWQVEQQ